MFFCPELLKKRRHPFFTLWIASTQQGRTLMKYLTARMARKVHLPSALEELLDIVYTKYPDSIPRHLVGLENFSLYLSAKLMHGSCVVLRRQACLLIRDITDLFKNLNKLRWSEEKNQIVKRVRKTCKSKDENGVVSVHRRSGFDLDFTGIINLEFDDGEDDEPLRFTNSVPESFITMNEEPSFKPADTLPDFGDEIHHEALLDILQGRDGEAQSDCNQHPEVTHEPEVSADRTMQQQFDHVPLEESTHLLGMDQLNDFHRSPRQLLEPEQTADVPILPATDSQDFTETHPEVLEQPTEAVEAFEPLPQQQSPAPDAGEAFQPLPQQQSPAPDAGESFQPLPQQQSPAPDAVAAGAPEVQQGLVQQGSDDLELAALVIEPPRNKRRRRRRVIREDLIEIPSDEMKRNIEDTSRTLKRHSTRHDAYAMLIKLKWLNTHCLKKPGRGGSLHAELYKLYDRHLVTRYNPEIEHEDGPVTRDNSEPEDIREERDRFEAERNNEASMQIVNESSSIAAVPELSVEDHGRHSSVTDGMFHFDDPIFGHDTQSNIAVQNMTPPMNNVSGLGCVQDETMQNFLAVQEDSRVVQLEDNLAVVEDPVIVASAGDHEEDTRRLSLKRPSPSDNGGETSSKRRREHSPSLPDKLTGLSLSALHVEAPQSGMPEMESGLFFDPLPASPAVSTSVNLRSAQVGVSEISEGAAIIPEMPTDVENSDLEAMEGASGVLGLIPEVSDRDQSISSSPPMSSDAVFTKVTSLTYEGPISIEDLCPINTRKRKAAGIFYNLLELHLNKQVVLQQARDVDDNVGPVHITTI